MTILTTLQKKFKSQAAAQKASIMRAKNWFKDKLKNLTAKQVLKDQEKRFITKSNLSDRYIGRMVLYHYDPKYKQTLPYYDKFPLAIIVKVDNKGFQALNLHYLPYGLRAKMLDGLLTVYKSRQFDEKRKLKLTYAMLKRNSRLKWFAPCFKKYLNGHVRSSFYIVDPEEWEMMLMLPTEQFAKKSKDFVWAESVDMLNKTGKNVGRRNR